MLREEYLNYSHMLREAQTSPVLLNFLDHLFRVSFSSVSHGFTGWLWTMLTQCKVQISLSSPERECSHTEALVEHQTSLIIPYVYERKVYSSLYQRFLLPKVSSNLFFRNEGFTLCIKSCTVQGIEIHDYYMMLVGYAFIYFKTFLSTFFVHPRRFVCIPIPCPPLLFSKVAVWICVSQVLGFSDGFVSGRE